MPRPTVRLESNLKNATETARSAEGSYTRMQQQLKALRAALENMPGVFESGTGRINKQNREAVQIHQQIVRLESALKNAGQSMGMYYRSVGNYSGEFNS